MDSAAPLRPGRPAALDGINWAVFMNTHLQWWGGRARSEGNSPPDLHNLPERLENFITSSFDQQRDGEVTSLEPLGHLLVTEGTCRSPRVEG